MKQWSILSDVVQYVQYNKYPIGHHELEVKAPEGGMVLICIKSYRITKERPRK